MQNKDLLLRIFTISLIQKKTSKFTCFINVYFYNWIYLNKMHTHIIIIRNDYLPDNMIKSKLSYSIPLLQDINLGTRPQG